MLSVFFFFVCVLCKQNIIIFCVFSTLTFNSALTFYSEKGMCVQIHLETELPRHKPRYHSSEGGFNSLTKIQVFVIVFLTYLISYFPPANNRITVEFIDKLHS